MATRSVINFSAGPAKLPDEVLAQAQLELRDYGKTGMSVMEMSHRSRDYDDIIKTAEKRFRELLSVPDNYSVLFMQGGGTGQFAAVPLNLMAHSKSDPPQADYMVTGTWSKKGFEEAGKYLKANKVAKVDKFITIPSQGTWQENRDSAYLYYCTNETINGVEFPFVPESKYGHPLVADMSSNILSRPVDVSKYGLIYAGAQKNIGTAGVAIVVVRQDLLGKSHKFCPTVLDYSVQHEHKSLQNTPPTYSIYITKLVFEWIANQGGVEEIERRNIAKSKLIYDICDSSDGFYLCPVEKAFRSRMNVPFRISGGKGEELEKTFISEAEKRGMKQLKGHRSVGGIRASLYNATTLGEAEKLGEFMNEFKEKHAVEV